MGLNETLLAAVRRQGYETATPIQSASIPLVLNGRDVLASAPTGTGKTAAFTLPMIQRLGKCVGKGRQARALVLAPTRELANQIAESLHEYGHGTGVKHVAIYGGVGQHKQVKALRAGVDVIIATPGRLEDLMEQGHVRLDKVTTLVLDEADRMLDMGFIPSIRRIVEMLPAGQRLMFSATVPPTIAKLVKELMHEPERIDVLPKEKTVDLVTQKVFYTAKADKTDLLAHLAGLPEVESAIVFSRTKHGADRIVKQLERRKIRAASIHGNKNQNQRQRALDAFKRGRFQLLVATDVAARGIDVDGVTHVINYDLTHEPETYVHRIGRTGRAGKYGQAWSFCEPDERAWLKDIQKLIGRQIESVVDHPFRDEQTPVPMWQPPQKKAKKPGQPGGKFTPGKPGQKKRPHPAAKAGKPGKPGGKWKPRPAGKKPRKPAAAAT
jgi:ATP-dependent RNA helicase RhlE